MTVNEDLLLTYENTNKPVHRVYEPKTVAVVLGAGRRDKGDVFVEAARKDGVPLLFRKGGGGSVVLSPGMVVLALVTEVASPYQNREYARRINSWIKYLLVKYGVTPVCDRGISDLALSDRKILGASLFRRKNLLFYQASLMVSNDLTLLDRYLTHPSQTPDYRRNRSHRDFCTNLVEAGYDVGTDKIAESLYYEAKNRLPEL
jgi:lipoate-protein ligase A